ncbi:MAG: hypothetical protein L6R40_004504 [Gallowayella cf. fulva]|nr:MAG: hypothetical protein L6R40_004504 [Xanthomendoza cf. fulva]
MRLTTSLLLLPLTLTAAQQQKPLGQNLQSWFEKAKSYLPSAPSAATSPLASTAAKAAANTVTPLTTENWKSVLSPSSTDPSQGPEEWMILFSGGNKSCYGRCAGVETAWNKSAALLAADPTAPKLAHVDCDRAAVLCTTWAAAVPTIWWVQIPVTGTEQSRPATTIRILGLNTTTVTAGDIVKIHREKTYEKKPVYEGALHPFDGWAAKMGLNVPLGYVLYGFANVPSWAFMIVISMGSRYIMSKRVGGGQAEVNRAQRSAPLGGAPPANEPVAR